MLFLFVFCVPQVRRLRVVCYFKAVLFCVMRLSLQQCAARLSEGLHYSLSGVRVWECVTHALEPENNHTHLFVRFKGVQCSI